VQLLRSFSSADPLSEEIIFAVDFKIVVGYLFSENRCYHFTPLPTADVQKSSSTDAGSGRCEENGQELFVSTTDNIQIDTSKSLRCY